MVCPVYIRFEISICIPNTPLYYYSSAGKLENVVNTFMQNHLKHRNGKHLNVNDNCETLLQVGNSYRQRLGKMQRNWAEI